MGICFSFLQNELYEALLVCRNQLAHEANSAPFMVGTNKLLGDLARFRSAGIDSQNVRNQCVLQSTIQFLIFLMLHLPLNALILSLSSAFSFLPFFPFPPSPQGPLAQKS